MRAVPGHLAALAIIGLAAIFVYEARGWKLEARLYPWIVGIATLVLAVIHLMLELRRGRVEPTETPGVVDSETAAGGDPRFRVAGVFAWSLGLLGGIWLLGFGIGVPLFLFFHLKAQSREGWGLSLGLAGVAGVTFWYVFDRLLHVPLPGGALFNWLEPR
jgi:cytochrome b561